MTALDALKSEPVVGVLNNTASSSIVLVCEHASAAIPESFEGLGLPADQLKSHVVWDPGAFAVASFMADMLDAKLVYGAVSRLVYDCNRPPDAPDAMPERSEVLEIPGNLDLSPEAKEARVRTYYHPFRDCVALQMNSTTEPVLVTIHSFTPVYHGVARDVEIGILHDVDDRLAELMFDHAPAHGSYNVQLNSPYGIEHGVTHTLKEHGVKQGHPNVMLEIRNDLIGTEPVLRRDISASLMP